MTQRHTFFLLPAVLLAGCNQATAIPDEQTHYSEVYISATGTPGEWEDTYLMIFEEQPSIAAFETIMKSAEEQPSEPSPIDDYDFTVTLADGDDAIAYHLWLPQDNGADGYIMYPTETHALHLVSYNNLEPALDLLGLNDLALTEEEDTT